MWVGAEPSLAGTDPVPLRSGCDPGSWLRPPQPGGFRRWQKRVLTQDCAGVSFLMKVKSESEFTCWRFSKAGWMRVTWDLSQADG